MKRFDVGAGSWNRPTVWDLWWPWKTRTRASSSTSTASKIPHSHVASRTERRARFRQALRGSKVRKKRAPKKAAAAAAAPVED